MAFTFKREVENTETLRVDFNPPVLFEGKAFHYVKVVIIKFEPPDEDGTNVNVSVSAHGTTLTTKGKEDKRQVVGYLSSLDEIRVIANEILRRQGRNELAAEQLQLYFRVYQNLSVGREFEKLPKEQQEAIREELAKQAEKRMGQIQNLFFTE